MPPDYSERDALFALVIERSDRTDEKLDRISEQQAEHSASLRALDTRIGGIEVRVGRVEVQSAEVAKELVVKDTRNAVKHEHEQAHLRTIEARGERRSFWIRWGAGSVAAVVVAVLSGLATLYLRGLIR